MAEQGEFKRIAVDKLDLDLENPRHGKLTTPEEAITHLIEKEKVIELALDIARKGGTNPMDLMGVFRRKSSSRAEVYISAEGNRRVCALMLLHDPEKVPKGVLERAKKIRALDAAVASSALPKAVNCIVFASKKDAMPWIELMHIADQDGRARKRWTADQQANAVGGGRNADAMQILERAEAFGLIEKTERDLKLTTVQRYLSNPAMRDALGLERAKDKSLVVLVEPAEFGKLFDEFMKDVRGGQLSSRSDSAKIKEYALGLSSAVQCDRTPTAAYPLAAFLPPVAAPTPSMVPPAPDVIPEMKPDPAPLVRPPVRAIIGRNAAVEAALFPLQSQKLTSLYLSCVQLPLKDNTPLITVGLWSILETLSGLHAGKEVQFVTYLGSSNLEQKFGITDTSHRKSMRPAIDRISTSGNSTKHHPMAGSFDGQQLANDFDILSPLVIAICSNIPK